MNKVEKTKKSLYILTEGQTEHAYFSRIKEIMGDEDDWRYSVTVDVREIVKGSKTDPFNMVKEAKKNLRIYDEVWVVFDKDRERDDENLKAFELAEKSKISVAYSSISFEQWILLHFERSIKPFERSDCESRKQPCICNGEKCALTYIKQNHYPNYVKGRAKLYDELVGLQYVALEYAAWLKWHNGFNPNFLLMNPYTDVDVLVAYLLELPTIQFVNLNTEFKFDHVSLYIIDLTIQVEKVSVTFLVTNNSNNSWVFNNSQTNMILLDKDNKEVNYRIPRIVICSQGESKEATIEFPINDDFVASRLKFFTPKEIVYFEL